MSCPLHSALSRVTDPFCNRDPRFYNTLQAQSFWREKPRQNCKKTEKNVSSVLAIAVASDTCARHSDMLCSEENSSAVANVRGQQQQVKNSVVSRVTPDYSVVEEGVTGTRKEEERGSSKNQEESNGEKVTTATDNPAGRLHGKGSYVLSWHFILDMVSKTCKLAICPCCRACSLPQPFITYST